MIITEGNELKMCLDGDWSMSGVAERLPGLTKDFAGVLDSHVAGEQHECFTGATPEIDLAGVTDVDACGCQLLALIVRNLKQNGINAHVTNLSEAFRTKIHLMGFDRELNLSL